MTRNGTGDPEFRLVHDEGGGRFLIGVESGRIKLAVIVPDGVSRTKLETVATDWVRELAYHVDAAEAQQHLAGTDERTTDGRERTTTGHKRTADGHERTAGNRESSSDNYDHSSDGHGRTTGNHEAAVGGTERAAVDEPQHGRES